MLKNNSFLLLTLDFPTKSVAIAAVLPTQIAVILPIQFGNNAITKEVFKCIRVYS